VELLSVFVGRDLELRSGWRVAAYTALFVVIFAIAGVFFGGLAVWLNPDWLTATRVSIGLIALNALVLAIPSIVALPVMVQFIDRSSLAAFGVALHEGWLRDIAMGVGVAVFMLAVTLTGSLAFGTVQMQWTGSLATIPTIVLTLIVLVVSAANEELLFRGYPMQVLMKGIGPWGAIMLISCAFGLVHRNNEGATTLSVLNTMLAGVMLSLAYLKTRSLWLPYGLHLGWNVGLSVILGFPVSGVETASLWTTTVSGPESILGGGYGPEDGAWGTVVFSLGACVLLLLRRVGISPQIRDALTANATKVWIGKA
jgi:membrane protease YdiL (CAAX protease family)